MSAKEGLILDVNGGWSITEAAERHGVARSCAYKLVQRYKACGPAGLEEQSRRPESSPKRTSQELVEELLELKDKYGHFGPTKLH
jgi:transposase